MKMVFLNLFQKICHTRLIKILFAVLLMISGSVSAQFTQGNLVVLQIGDGTSAMAATGNALLFKEYSTVGAPTFSLGIPITGTNALVLRGNASSEGYISLSSDGYQVVFGAYAKALPNLTTLNSVAASTINRGIGVISGSGIYSLAALAASPFANGDIRGAAATNSLNLWSAGSSQGLAYFGNSASAGTVENAKSNLRATHIFNNQLYISSQVSTGTPTDIGVYSVGSGTPLTSSQTVSTVINTGSGSQPGQFYFNPSNTICYVADARNSSGGGIQKWVYSSPTWTLAYTLPTGTTLIGAFGVVADFSGPNPIVYATTTEANNNRLVAINDLGAASTATTLATATVANTIFRGLCFSPGICIAPSSVTCTYNSPACSNQPLSFTTTVLGSSPFNYHWFGQGVFSSTAVANPTLNNAASGFYTLNVSNSCGTSSTVISLNVFPSPTIQVNAPSICAGGIATLVASGAVTYTWSTGNTSSSFTVSPISNTSYTLSGTSANACAANPITTTVSITTSVNVSVNSATICAGASAVLNASGASTYTWSNSSTSSSIVVSPTSSTNYTVMANASGCPNVGSAIANVIVNPLPVVSIVVSQTLICSQILSVPLTGLPSGGIFSGNGVSGTTFTPQVAGFGDHTISYTYTDVNLCSNTVTKVLRVWPCHGLNEITNAQSFKVYPNPSSGVFELEILSEQNITVYNTLGQLILEKKYPSGKHQMDLTAFENGIYFLKLESLGTTSSIKLLKAAN